MAAAQPKKIAILGGGIGSLTTAFALTNERGWQQHFDITIYQTGWRLGGKGASGRNPDADKGQRIEEHGFHVWLGFYDNAFNMIKTAYAELARTVGPFKTWEDAFKKHSLVVLEEMHDGHRKRWRIEFPTGPREPGTVVQLGLIGYAARLFRLLVRRLPDSPRRKTTTAAVPRIFQFVWRTIFLALLVVLAVAEYLLRSSERIVARRLPRAYTATATVLRPLRRMLGWISGLLRLAVEAITRVVIAWATAVDVSDVDDARRLLIFFDLSLAVLRGILVDDVIANGFESIDDMEFKDWLRKHKAREESINSALVESIYDGNFSYTKGDRARPNFAAGVALHCYLRIFLDYKGAFLYKMQAGMGDVVVTPLYQVLKKRGVKFKFFHHVDRLVYDHAAQTVSGIDVTEQVALAGGEYEPLIEVRTQDGVIDCWPSSPRFEQIRDGDLLARSGIDLESQWATPWAGRAGKRLHKGTDFDLIVLGISIGALGPICQQLIERRSEWRSMIEAVDTVATQAMQLWLQPGLSALGWPFPPSLVVNYEEPAPNWLDASHVIAHECLPATRIGSVAYFCAALEDAAVIPPPGPNSFPGDQRQLVRHAYQRWLEQDASGLWPDLTIKGGLGVQWDMLYDGQNRSGPARFEWQYFRANVEPSDRFVLSSVGPRGGGCGQAGRV